MSFGGRRVVVTGGGGFLGMAVVRALLDEGAEVHVPAVGERDQKRLAGIDHAMLRVTPSVDLTDEAQTIAFYDAVPGPLWASLHIAGGFVWGPLAETDVEAFDKMVALNLRTCWLCCREAAKRMDEGRIVNVAAKPTLVPCANVATYAATKSAVVGLTLSLDEELHDRGVFVNAIAPSIMDTPTNRSAMPDADFDAWPKVEEVAATMVFLASPANKTTRGALIPVYGRS